MTDGVVLGTTADGEEVTQSYDRRRQHTYVIGVNGTGKTTLLRQMAYEDMRQEPKHGLCVIDPHGDLIDDIIALVPKERLNDVILFDPSDEANPFALNLFAPVEPEEIPRVASEIVSIFQKIFGRGWTPEIEGVIQNVTLTLLSRPADFEMEKGKPWVASMDEIPALLAMERVSEEDREKPPWKRKVETYRSQFYRLLQAQDQIPVWEFWNYNFDTLTPRPRSELTLAVLNQVRRFLANPVVRNIVAQTESKLDLSEVMNDGRILLVNLSKGKLGEANSAFLGSVVVAKLVVAVFARAAIPPAERKPFHIIADEFQNFAISSFPSLLSEGRKYNVDLVIAHQYREQLRDWVQGATVNAGNVICFRVGGDDARELCHEFDAAPPEVGADMAPLYVKISTPKQTKLTHAGRGLRGTRELLKQWCGTGRWILEEIPRADASADSYGKPMRYSRSDFSDMKIPALRTLRWLEALALGCEYDHAPHITKDSYPPETWSGDKAGGLWLATSREEPDLVAWADAAYVEFPRNYDPTGNGFDELSDWIDKNRPPEVAIQVVGRAIKAITDAIRAEDEHPHYVQSESSKGRRYTTVSQRPRPYSDLYGQIANELTHLPNFEAKCRLAGSADPIIEQSVRTMEWPEGHGDSAEREKHYARNLKAIKDNTHRDFTRPKDEVARDFQKRYELMLRSIGMSWTHDEPLPKPQVLYEDDD